jgi:predicted membrane-bound spermidine synthase
VSAGRAFVLLLALFFFSGACGLTYQVLWLRQLSLVFGVTVYAASTVLAAFMAGLALGSMLAGPLLQRLRRPLMVFGAAEILIGLSAAASPFGLDAAEGLYRALYQAFPDSFALLTAARLMCALPVLLLPTMLMGVTLPVLSASSVVRASYLGSHLGALYAVNTAGAVVGALLTGFVLIGAIGMARSFLLAATVNVVVGLLALLWSRVETPHVAIAHPHEREDDEPGGAAPAGTVVPIVIALSGVAALALEIVWFRMLVLYLDATTYAFTAMLATVLAGIAIGGAIAARLLRRARDWAVWLTLIQIGTGIAVLASATFLAWSYGARWRVTAPAQASAAAMLPAALLMGVGFPIALRLGIGGLVRDAVTTGRRVGQLYALNVAGAIVGALLGGFVLLPQLGTRGALVASAAVYAATAALLAVRFRSRRGAVTALALCIAAFALMATRVPDPFDAAYERRYGRDMHEFWRHDGVQTAVSVHASQFRRALYLDGLHQANDTPDMVRLHRIIGHLPMVLHPAPVDALVVGLGGGATAGAVSQYPGVRVQVVELSDGVRQAASFFSHVNYDLLNQPHVRLRVDDGRNFLLLSGERFDVITADIIQPIHAGAGNLYSREYFALVRGALEENGLAMQWIGHRPATQYRLIMRTFLDVFPDATLWLDGALMVGSLAPLRLNPTLIHAKRAHPPTAAALDDIGLRDFATLASWYTAGPAEMRQFVGDGVVLSDDRPLVEYHRSLPANDPPVDVTALRGDVGTVIRP